MSPADRFHGNSGDEGGMHLFDPTIYENMKVVIQGAVYDLDLRGAIRVTDRHDEVDLAVMSRTFCLRFMDARSSHAFAEMVLKADMRDFAAEILELHDNGDPGCRLEIRFEHAISVSQQADSFREAVAFMEGAARDIHGRVAAVWEDRPEIRHEITGSWKPVHSPKGFSGVRRSLADSEPVFSELRHRMVLDFNRTIDEKQIEDIPALLELMVETLHVLNDGGKL